MKIRWEEHSEKGVTDGQTDGRTDGGTEVFLDLLGHSLSYLKSSEGILKLEHV